MKENEMTMTRMFKGYTNYTIEEYKNVWENGLIVVDTNVLLNLYRYSDDTRKKMLDIFEQLKKRLWIPYQVGYEFYKNKDNVIAEACKEYDDLLKKTNDELVKLNGEIDHKKNNRLKCKDELKGIITEVQNKISEILQQEKKQKESIIGNDDIEKIILSFFNKNIGLPFEEDEFLKIKEEGIRRQKNNIPPGYMDSKKEFNGDYHIFYSMIDEAKKEHKDIIYITDDAKEDWFKKNDGKINGGRPELLNEFFYKTNCLLLIYTVDGFVEAYNKNLSGEPVDEKLIDELKNYKYYNLSNSVEEILDDYTRDLIELDWCIDKEEYIRICNSLLNDIDKHIMCLETTSTLEDEKLILELRKIKLLIKEKQNLETFNKMEIISELKYVLKKYYSYNLVED